MSPQPGSRLGPYEITAKLGEGGMGEVYRATDSRLKREVAIKVLPAEFTADKERLARFEREAQLLAQLHHPNIASIFGLEEADGVLALVMELVEGPTLAERLESGPLPLEETLSIARQIAQALEAAHEKGIIHRDLKPQNIKAPVEGSVKILDFGLAKAMDPVGATSTLSAGEASATWMHSPTLAAHGTEAGLILGTAAYMAPEQARGLAVDRRADIWAFGAVLYEMLAGRRAFEGETASDLVAAVLTREPEWQALPATVGPALRRLLVRCLEKDSARRYRDIGDVGADLETAATLDAERLSSVGDAADGSGSPSGGRLARLAPAIALLAIIAAALLGAQLWRTSTVAPQPLHFEELTFLPMFIANARFAPDGETAVFSALREENTAELFVKRPEDPLPQPLGSRGVHLLAVSSTGELAVLTRARFLHHRTFIGTLARMPLAGSSPREVLEGVTAADWSPDGAELAIVRQVGDRSRLEFPIGNVLAESGGYLSDPRVSPRGDLIAFMVHPWADDNRGRVVIVDTAGREIARSPGSPGEEGLTWSPDQESVVFSADFGSGRYSLWSMDLEGGLRELFEDTGDLVVFDYAANGRLLAASENQENRLFARLAGEPEEREIRWLGVSIGGAIADDGSALLFCDQSESAGVNYAAYLVRPDGAPPLRLSEGWPLAISPDGTLVLSAVPSDPPQLFLYPTGAGASREITMEGFATSTADFFPDGASVLLCGAEAGKGRRCYARDLASDDVRAVTPEGTEFGRVDPDGRSVVARRADGSWARFRLNEDGDEVGDGSQEETIAGLDAYDEVIRVQADGKSLFVFRPADVPTAIERLDLVTGERTRVREIVPLDPIGAFRFWWIGVSADGSAYGYNYTRAVGRLFSVEGVS